MPQSSTPPASFDLSGKTVLVTGAGSGIGRELALAFARAGARVVCAGRQAARLEAVAAAILAAGGQALAVATDITNRAEVDRLVRTARGQFGPVDLLFNNAGSFGAIGPVWDADPDRWWHDVTVNLRGPMLLAHAVLPDMMTRNSGVIINMDGGGGACGPDIVVHRLGTPGAPRFNGANVGGSAYGASKAALMRFTEGLARELEIAGSRVLVFGLNPGFVRTEMTEQLAGSPAGAKWQEIVGHLFQRGVDRPPADCAAAALRLLQVAGPQLNGCVFDVDTDFAEVARQAARVRPEELYVMRLRDPRVS